MLKILLVVSLSFSLLSLSARENSSAHSLRLQEIEQMINNLQQQKQALYLEFTADQRKEMNLEMHSQEELIEYNWSGMSHALKAAEAAEQEVRLDKIKLEAVEAEIKKLSLEKERLLQKKIFL